MLKHYIAQDADEVCVWLDEKGDLYLKSVCFGVDPVEMTEGQARTLADILLRYANGELE